MYESDEEPYGTEEIRVQKIIKELKSLGVKSQYFELCAGLRDIEKSMFVTPTVNADMLHLTWALEDLLRGRIPNHEKDLVRQYLRDYKIDRLLGS